MDVALATKDRFVTVDGLKIRYLEEGSGVPAVLLHGNSLGSSADVFRRNLAPLAASGIRAIAFDLPGFGKTPDGPSFDNGFRKKILFKFMDALNLPKAALIGHSAAGNIAVSAASTSPSASRISWCSAPAACCRRSKSPAPRSAATRRRPRRGSRTAW